MVIDVWPPIAPTAELMQHVQDNFPEEMLGYLRGFYKVNGLSLNTARKLMGRIGAFFSFEQFMDSLDAAGISNCCLSGFDERSSVGAPFVPTEMVAPIIQKYPHRFIGFAGVDPLRGMPAVRELEMWVRTYGFRGVSFRPFMIGYPPNHRKYYPFYAKCVELNILVSIHASGSWSASRVADVGHPRYIDEVAVDFPELKIIVSHAGFPWVLEATILAWRHPNVYLDLAAHRSKYYDQPGSGWLPLLNYGQTTVRDKILFGSGWLLLGKQPVRILEEFRALPVKPEVLNAWLHDNAARLFSLQ
ncbi:MAG: amidohydrolase [Acidobacteria bacterium]|nr:amidohydrolase [Acidobacteriota bacterium]